MERKTSPESVVREIRIAVETEENDHYKVPMLTVLDWSHPNL